MDDLISVVLPVYNGEKFLAESIESVRNQSYRNWELVVVDDCSTDRTPEIVRAYEQKDPRIHYYVNQTNLKLPGNLNRGFRLAKGEYLTWTSDDNKFRPMALETMLQTLKSAENAHLAYASYQIIDQDGREIDAIYADSRGKQHIVGSNVVGACFLYTREAYETIGEYDPELFLVEDFDYWQRMMIRFEAVPIKEILYDYRWHDNSLTSKKNEKQFGATLEKMLLKNRPGFGKLSAEADYYYKMGLNQAREKQGGFNPYRFSYQISKCRWYFRRLFER